MEIPAGVWRFLDAHGKDIGRVATALERIAEELTAIRRELQEQDTDQKEDE